MKKQCRLYEERHGLPVLTEYLDKQKNNTDKENKFSIYSELFYPTDLENGIIDESVVTVKYDCSKKDYIYKIEVNDLKTNILKLLGDIQELEEKFGSEFLKVVDFGNQNNNHHHI